MKKLLIYISVLTSPFIHGQDSLTKKWFQVGLNIAIIGNSSYSNLYASEQTRTIPYGTIKSNRIVSRPIDLGFSFGVEAILGKSKSIKQVIGINYDFTNSHFNYVKNVSVPSGAWKISSYYENLDKERRVQFLSGNYGVKMCFKSLSLTTLASYNYILSTVEIQNGYIKQSNGTIFPDSIVINNKKSTLNRDTNFISIKLRLAYAINLNRQSFCIFIMRNLNIFNIITPEHAYLAPWYYFGLQWLPRQSTKKKV